MQAREGLSPILCRNCGGEGVQIVPRGATAEASVCECSRYCRVCQNSRYLFEKDGAGREMARMCECEKTRIRVKLYNEARLPGRFADARLHDACKDRFNSEAFTTLKLLVDEYQRGHKGILLMGPAGVGKTWLVSAFLRELIFRHGVSSLFQDFFHLLSSLRSGYSQDKPESELIDPLVGVEVLVIDELGKGRNTPWEQNILDVIISQRYNNQKTTLFTSNYTDSRTSTLVERLRPRDAQPGDGDVEIKDTLRERVGPRIYSRLKEMCDAVTIGGLDRRELEHPAIRT